jgi:hypothetical protein
MANLKIELTGSAVVNGARNYTLPDTAVTRLLEAMKLKYGGTNGQALAAWADGLIAGTKREVVQIEQNNAVITPVDITNV